MPMDAIAEASVGRSSLRSYWQAPDHYCQLSIAQHQLCHDMGRAAVCMHECRTCQLMATNAVFGALCVRPFCAVHMQTCHKYCTCQNIQLGVQASGNNDMDQDEVQQNLSQQYY